MRLTSLRLVTFVIILLSLSYLITGVLSLYDISELSFALVFPFLLLYYFIRKQLKFSFFTIFLLFYTLAETTFFYKNYVSFSYYSEIFYGILAFLALLVFVFLQINFKALFKKFYVQIIILILLGVYVFYTLERIMVSHFAYGLSMIDFVIDSMYNLSFILVLIFSLLNYLQTDSKKNLILFLSCGCLVFSELVQVIYFFADQKKILHIVYSFLLISGCCLSYLFINIKDDKYILE